MDKKNYDKRTQIFKALANPVRLAIIDFLISGEKCVCEITKQLKCEQPHISKSLSRLKAVGLIIDRKDGLNVYYSLRMSCAGDFIGCLNKLID